MGADQLLDAYPDCRHAVAFTELIFCIPDEGEDCSVWDYMNTHPVSTLDFRLDIIQKVLQREIDERQVGKNKEALEETYHPSFRNYLAAKMGMM